MVNIIQSKFKKFNSNFISIKKNNHDLKIVGLLDQIILSINCSTLRIIVFVIIL
jgi:hypothetical protein